MWCPAFLLILAACPLLAAATENPWSYFREVRLPNFSSSNASFCAACWLFGLLEFGGQDRLAPAK
jgi:hypothetical protein